MGQKNPGRWMGSQRPNAHWPGSCPATPVSNQCPPRAEPKATPHKANDVQQSRRPDGVSVPAIVRDTRETEDPLALADPLLRDAETADEPAPLIAAAGLSSQPLSHSLVGARTGQEAGEQRGEKATGYLCEARELLP